MPLTLRNYENDAHTVNKQKHKHRITNYETTAFRIYRIKRSDTSELVYGQHVKEAIRNAVIEQQVACRS